MGLVELVNILTKDLPAGHWGIMRYIGGGITIEFNPDPVYENADAIPPSLRVFRGGYGDTLTEALEDIAQSIESVT